MTGGANCRLDYVCQTCPASARAIREMRADVTRDLFVRIDLKSRDEVAAADLGSMRARYVPWPPAFFQRSQITRSKATRAPSRFGNHATMCALIPRLIRLRTRSPLDRRLASIDEVSDKRACDVCACTLWYAPFPHVFLIRWSSRPPCRLSVHASYDFPFLACGD